jgi:signal transduction histidine kinase/CheY-like chemotaxis protein
MRHRAHATGAGSQSRAYYDIAQVLAVADDAEARVVHVLERLRALVPYDRCAVLEASPGRAPRLVTAPGTPPDERADLLDTLSALLAPLVEEHGHSLSAARPTGHLAAPLVGLDEVTGVLYVRGTLGEYGPRHVRSLSVVAAKLAAYFSMLHAVALQAEQTREVEAARQIAETANRAKDEFLALVSHELRTPLTIILAWADTLRSDAGEADRLRAFEAIERSVHAQAKLIDDLLDLSCVATATLRLDLHDVDPAALIKEALQGLRPRAEERSIHLEAVLDETIRPILADPQRLSQVVANLVANAIKFTPRGGRVEVRLERAGMRARIRVIDNGAGIRPETLPHLFEPFSQADSSTTRAHGGLGVGLALVKDLVALHGGRVSAESPGEQQGATFTVELPLSEAAAPAPDPADAPVRKDTRALAGIRVLVVDDDRDICEVLQFVLEGQGAVVTLAGSAPEALVALERSMPDVLLSDVVMPGESGYDLMRKVVARQGGRAVPAAALSGHAVGQDLERALASGFRMQLHKPIDPEALVAAVAVLAEVEA